MFWSGFPILAVSGGLLAAPLILFVGFTGTMYFVGSFVFYRNSVAKSNEIVRPDMLEYLASWQSLLDQQSEESANTAMAQLASLAVDIQNCIATRHDPEALARGSGGRMKARHRMIMPSLTDALGGGSLVYTREESYAGSEVGELGLTGPLVKSLDYAYHQVCTSEVLW